MRDPFVFRPLPRPDAALRLICIHSAGYGAAMYREWGRAFSERIDICAVRLPGRESLTSEPPFRSFPALLEAALKILLPYTDKPFAIFGHSMGAWLGFEISRRLRGGAGAPPLHLFVSGRRAPQLKKAVRPIHDLEDDALIAAIQERYNGIPNAVLKERELLELMLPVLRADLAALSSYEYREEPALSCPISCFAGLDDPEVSRADLEAWSVQTNHAFRLRQLPGDHFYLNGPAAAALTAEIEQTLSAPTAAQRS